MEVTADKAEAAEAEDKQTNEEDEGGEDDEGDETGEDYFSPKPGVSLLLVFAKCRSP